MNTLGLCREYFSEYFIDILQGYAKTAAAQTCHQRVCDSLLVLVVALSYVECFLYCLSIVFPEYFV